MTNKCTNCNNGINFQSLARPKSFLVKDSRMPLLTSDFTRLLFVTRFLDLKSLFNTIFFYLSKNRVPFTFSCLKCFIFVIGTLGHEFFLFHHARPPCNR